MVHNMPEYGVPVAVRFTMDQVLRKLGSSDGIPCSITTIIPIPHQISLR
jgi:hypothetical protein